MTATFRAMNTSVTVAAPTLARLGAHLLTRRIRSVFNAAEATFSRFDPRSELSRLNARAGTPVVVSAELFSALERARRYWELTDGWFDPTVGRALCAAGYDRSFAPGALDRTASIEIAPSAATFGEVRLDARTRTVLAPAGVTLDCGGFIKGWSVDRAAHLLPSNAAVDAGGDAVLRGNGPTGRGWLLSVEDPRRPTRSLLEIVMSDRAVATSGPNRRHWSAGGRHLHHLIDPHTGQSSQSDLAQVTVIAAAAEFADVAAKTVYLLGLHAGQRFLDRFPDVAAVLVRRDGQVSTVKVGT